MKPTRPASTDQPNQLRSLATAPPTRKIVPAQPSIPFDSPITAQKQRYQQYMPVGMVELFKGTQFWKMPADVEINVGPTIIEELPRGYTDATENYSHGARRSLAQRSQ